MDIPDKPTNIEISRSQLDDLLNGLVRDFLPPATFILSILYIAFAIGHLFVIAPPINKIMFTIALSTAVTLIAIAISLSKKTLPLNLAHPVCSFIAMLIIINS